MINVLTLFGTTMKRCSLQKNSGRYQSYFTSEGAYFGIMSPSEGCRGKTPVKIFSSHSNSRMASI